MWDITVKKSSSAVAAAPPAFEHEESEPEKAALSWQAAAIEWCLHAGSSFSTWIFQSIGSPDSPEVITPSSHPKPANRRQNSRKKAFSLAIQSGKRVSGRLKSVVPSKSQVKEKAGRAGRAAKSPAGMLAIAQTLAIIALFVTVSALRKDGASLGVRNIGQTFQQEENVRQFLPTAADSVPAVASFDEKQAATASGALPFHAWITPWNSGQLANDAPYYQSLSAFWLTLNPDGITVTPKGGWDVWDQFQATAKKPSQKLYLTISGDPNYSYLTLASPSRQQQHIAALLGLVESRHFDGIDIDYEGLGTENRDLFTSFVQNLADTFHAKGKLVSVTLEARLANQVPMDWKAVGQAADQVRIMAYDYHGRTTGQPGAIAPLGWLKEILDYAHAAIDPAKTVIGIGNYGYDWTEKDAALGTWEGTGVSYDEAMALAKEHSAPIIRLTGIDERGYDNGPTPCFTYQDAQQRQHAVCFEDDQSLQAKLHLVSQYPTAGVIFWSVGSGDPNFWKNQPSQ